MFPLACNLTKNNVEFLPVEISLKKVRESDVDFSISEITLKKLVEMMWCARRVGNFAKASSKYF